MNSLPDVVILVGQVRELNAVRECIKLNIPLITILDTNCDPTLTDFSIPANDDSISSVSLILNELVRSIIVIFLYYYKYFYYSTKYFILVAFRKCFK